MEPAPRRGSRRRWTVLGVLLGLALVATAAAVGMGSGGRSSAPPRHPAPRRPQPKPVHHRAVRRYRRVVPILMYHLIERVPAGAVNPELYVRPRTFAAQMRWLARHGYNAVTLARVVRAWHGRARLPRRPIVLTFDDGYRDDYRDVLPVLRRLHWVGVLDLTTSSFRSRGGLTRWQVRRLLAAGWELASHTISHLDLTTLHRRRLRREVAGSRRLLEREFGVPVSDFAYPSGRYDRAVLRAVRAAGYSAAVTTTPGFASPRHRLQLRRLRVDQAGGVPGLADQLRAARRGRR